MSYRDALTTIAADAERRAGAVFDAVVPLDGVVEDLDAATRARLIAALTAIVLAANARSRALAATSVAATLSARRARPVAPVVEGPELPAERARLTAALDSLLDAAAAMEVSDAAA